MANTSTTAQNERQANSGESGAARAEGAVKSMASAARDHSGNLIHGAKDYAESASQKAKETYQEMEETLKDQSDILIEFVKEQPVKSLLFAAGAGYLLSYLYRK
jgi:ElaB/YqjD/DUF883 family membrane-anchored ribosome-binding protein